MKNIQQRRDYRRGQNFQSQGVSGSGSFQGFQNQTGEWQFQAASARGSQDGGIYSCSGGGDRGEASSGLLYRHLQRGPNIADILLPAIQGIYFLTGERERLTSADGGAPFSGRQRRIKEKNKRKNKNEKSEKSLLPD